MQRSTSNSAILRRHKITTARLAAHMKRHETYLRMRVRNLRVADEPADTTWRDGMPWASWAGDCPFCGMAGSFLVDALTGRWSCVCDAEGFAGCNRSGSGLSSLETHLLREGFIPFVKDLGDCKDRAEVERWDRHFDAVLTVIGGERGGAE